MLQAQVDIEPLRRWCELAVAELPWKVSRRLLSTVARRIARQLRDTVRTSDAPPAVRRAGQRVAGWRVDKKRGVHVGFIRMPRGEHRISARNIHWLILGTADRYTRDRPPRYRGRMRPFLQGLLPLAVQTSWQAALAEGEQVVRTMIEEMRRTVGAR